MNFVCGLFLGMIGFGSAAGDACGDHPTGVRSAEIAAVISLDGREFTASGIWRLTVKEQYGIDAGVNNRVSVEGEALVFDLGAGERLFLVPSTSPISICAVTEAPERADGKLHLAEAVDDFDGSCELDPSASFVLASDDGDAIPAFGDFGWNKERGAVERNGGEPDFPAIVDAVLARGFTLKSLRATATDAPLTADMLTRFPWIGALLRTDCGEGCSYWAAGYVYANDFTTALPPLDCPPTTGDRMKDMVASKDTPCDPFRKRPADAIKYER